MKRFQKLLIIIFTIIIVIKLTTYGWGIISKPSFVLTNETELAAQRLKNDVYTLSNEIGNRNTDEFEKLEEAASYISKQFESMGYTIEFESYEASGKQVKNIIAIKKGTKKLNEIIVIGAHYDSCFNPGADDNASGVAGLLGLARSFSNKENDRTIKFVAFVNEEPPYFKTDKMGSRVFAKVAKSNKEDIKAAIILEMIGYYSNDVNSQRYPPILGMAYPNKGNFVLLVGNSNSHEVTKNVIENFKRTTRFPIEKTELGFIPGIDFSDHWSFWQEGYNAIMVTDSAFYRNSNYHKNTDTYEKLDYSKMGEVIKGLSNSIEELLK